MYYKIGRLICYFLSAITLVWGVFWVAHNGLSASLIFFLAVAFLLYELADYIEYLRIKNLRNIRGMEPCDHCKSSGKIGRRRCPKCKGKGYIIPEADRFRPPIA
jgi:hypothetical protein